MVDSAIKTDNDQLFLRELLQSMEQIALEHGYSMPQCPIAATDQGIHLSASFYRQDAELLFQRWFELHARSMGLKPEHYGRVIEGEEIGESVSIIGLDPAGGERCVVAKGEEGCRYFLTPDYVAKKMNELGT